MWKILCMYIHTYNTYLLSSSFRCEPVLVGLDLQDKVNRKLNDE
jgi:hypothetical protein